jgi:hypothetical protein
MAAHYVEGRVAVQPNNANASARFIRGGRESDTPAERSRGLSKRKRFTYGLPNIWYATLTHSRSDVSRTLAPTQKQDLTELAEHYRACRNWEVRENWRLENRVVPIWFHWQEFVIPSPPTAPGSGSLDACRSVQATPGRLSFFSSS